MFVVESLRPRSLLGWVGSADQEMAMHPLARWVAGLSTPMSLRDQRMVTQNVSRIIYGSLVISLICGYLVGHVNLTFYGVAAGGALSLVLYVPNWYQHSDDDQQWCDDAEVKKYYSDRQQLLDDVGQQEMELAKDK